MFHELRLDEHHLLRTDLISDQVHKCKCILSSLEKLSAESPSGIPASFTPTMSRPPLLLRNQAIVLNTSCSILGSRCDVCKIVRSVDLNFVSTPSPRSIDRLPAGAAVNPGGSSPAPREAAVLCLEVRDRRTPIGCN
jgi:hypothetical protein